MQAKSQRTGPLLRWLWRDYLRPHKGTLALAVLLMAIEGAMLGFLSKMIQPMFDTVFLQGNNNALFWVGFGICGIFFVRAVASAGQRILTKKVSELAAAGMRGNLLRHLMALDSGYHQINPPGQLIERVQGDVTVVNNTWANLLVGVGRDLVAVVVLFGVALSVDWRWTLVALIGIPFLVLPSLLAQAYAVARTCQCRGQNCQRSGRGACVD